MFNNVKVLKNHHYGLDGKKYDIYLLEIDGKQYPAVDFDNHDDYFYDLDMDIDSFDVVLSTSSLDNLEKFILKLLKEDNDAAKFLLMELLFYFWSSYTDKLSKAMYEVLDEHGLIEHDN